MGLAITAGAAIISIIVILISISAVIVSVKRKFSNCSYQQDAEVTYIGTLQLNVCMYVCGISTAL